MMPWESQQQGSPIPRPAPVDTRPVVPYPQPAAPQQMQYDVPPPPPQPAPRQAPAIDIRAAIQQAVNEAVQQNKNQFVANAQNAIEKAVDKKTAKLEDEVEHLEESFSGGVVTTRTFVQGAAVDIGFAVLAAAATVIGPDANVFDKELWSLVGVMMLKTVIQTGMSYMMRLQVK